MLKFLNKTVMLTLLCLIFIGQSVASSVMFYNMSGMNNGIMQEHHIMDYDYTQGIDSATQTSESDECCSQEKHCFASVCAMVSAVSRITNTDFFSGKSPKITSIDSHIASQTLTSLYRPPIFS